ncbi:MAG: TAXI family TRAP transporter solute-binding subunit [Kiritimatiellia bacterium]|jgi:TRAP transporter TAXI family solute receptor|nr:TAXI family TRAP transporter solute-binding subunit [Kiritimatiellia bacterium]
MKSKKRASRSLAAYLGVYGPALVLAVVGFVVAYQFAGPPPPKTITMATGSEQGAYYHFGLKYATWLERHNIELRVIKTPGSTENIKLLANDASGVEAAFVQGGTGDGQAGLLSLGSLYYEPLWVFHRKESPVRFLSDLKGRKIALGSESSGTRAIAARLVKENGVNLDANPATSGLSGMEAVTALKAGKVEAAFFVASPEAPLVKGLLADSDLLLLSMTRAEAYTRRNAFLSPVHVSEGMLDLELNIPSSRVQLISPTANLVIREDLHPALIDLLLQAARSVHGGGGMFERPGEFPAPKQLAFPLSPEAERFYEYGPPFLQRFFPFWIATLVDRLKVLMLPLIVLLIPLLKIVPPTLRWKIRRKIIRWYREIQALDVALNEESAGSRLEEFASEIDRIEREVTRVHVPLGYADQLYNLRLHIGLVRSKIVKCGSKA